jgi:alkylation response protein AidB-like acyl-CoA dehydrogenase
MSTTGSVLGRTRALVPYFRERAADAERARRVAPEGFEALAEAGILRMCAPRKYGGDELDFRTQCEVLAELARACPSTSWVATILSAMAWMVGTFPDQAQEEILAEGDPRVSGVFSPTGTLQPVSGGYRISGRWGYNTGGHGSNWTIVNAMLGELPISAILRSSELTRLDDWDAMGMTATGSDTVVADDVFVPAHRTQPLPGMINGDYTAERHNADEPYFRLPLAAVLAINAGGTPVGTARGAMDAFMERLPGRAITYTTYEVQSEASITHLQVAEAALLIDSADAHIAMAAALLDDAPDGGPTFHDRVKGRAHVGYATGLSRQAVDLLFHSSGASCIQPHVPIQRFQRDIQSLANHAIMHAATNVETYGRVLCGLEPNTLLV